MLESLFNIDALKYFIEKRLQLRYFPGVIAKFLRTAFVIEQRWLLSTVNNKCNRVKGRR